MKVAEKEAKTILTKSNLPGSDYVVNPYSGCAFGCAYCYADFMRKFTGHMNDEWGEYVDVKMNTPEIFERELEKINKRIVKKNIFKKGSKPVIFFGSVTDPYQGAEGKYKLTRKCLEVIAGNENKNNFEISLLTKSPLVVRDIDILKRIPNLEIGMTITSTDNSISRLFEQNAPPVSFRIKALKELNDNGINTYAFVGPLLPVFAKDENNIRKLFKQIKDAGTNKVWVEHINLSGKKMGRLINLVKTNLTNEEIRMFEESQTEEYKRKLNNIVMKIIKEEKIELVGGKIIDHIKLKKEY
jgi:DNA repair photolyase